MSIQLDPAVARDVVNTTAAFESGKDAYTSINANTDDAGVSFGLINWSQKGGGLHELLTAMYTIEPAAFGRIFGPAYRDLLRVAERRALDPVDGAVLWQEPWLSRWRAAGQDAALRRVQLEMALNGSYMKAAAQAMVKMGLSSERALAVVFDRAVQQGATRVRRVADQVAREAQSLPSETARLRRFIALITPLAGRWASDAQRRADAIMASTRIGTRQALAVS